MEINTESKMKFEWPKLIMTTTKTEGVEVHVIEWEKTPTATTKSIVTTISGENQLERRATKFILKNKTIFEELAKL